MKPCEGRAGEKAERRSSGMDQDIEVNVLPDESKLRPRWKSPCVREHMFFGHYLDRDNVTSWAEPSDNSTDVCCALKLLKN
jgi:hypothetical protein